MKNILNKFGKKKVLVIGDLMLDRYLWGHVERISPEAPVPVLNVREENESPGGAANVALNLRSLGASVELIGLTGKDDTGEALIEALKRNKIKTTRIHRDSGVQTTSKTRLIAGNTQIARIDKEECFASPKIEAMLTKKIKTSINTFHPDAILVSDYNKGVVTESLLKAVIKLAKKLGIFIMVDPKGDDFSKYKGVNVLTPNQKEAETASGITITDNRTLHKAATIILKDTAADCVLITRGKDGISYLARNSALATEPSHTIDVFDVTGAGDTVVSAFVLSYLATNSYPKSVRIANAAGGIVVSRIGASSVTQQDILIQLAENTGKSTSKILTKEALTKKLSAERANGKKIIFTNGCFDLFHTGHLTLLRKARALGEILVLGINSDSSVKRIKGKGRPFISEHDRANLLTALDCVDFLTVFEEDTPLELIHSLKPHVIVKGGDYKSSDVIGKEFVETYGGEVHIIPLVDGISTTELARKIKNS